MVDFRTIVEDLGKLLLVSVQVAAETIIESNTEQPGKPVDPAKLVKNVVKKMTETQG